MALLTPGSGLIIWMLLAFLIVAVVLIKNGFPAIIKMVGDRKDYIDTSLKNAKEANEKLANIKLESESILKEAREKQAQILREAAATRDAIVKEAKDQAQAEGAKMLEEAKKQIELEKQNAINEIRGQVAQLSVEVAEKVLRKDLGQEDKQMDLIGRLLDEVSVSKS